MRLILCLLLCVLIVYCATPPFPPPSQCYVGFYGNGIEPDLQACPATTKCCMSFKQANSLKIGFNCSSAEGCNYVDNANSTTPGFLTGLPVRDAQCNGDSAFDGTNYTGSCWGSYCRGPNIQACKTPNMCFVGQSYYNGTAVPGQQKPTLTNCTASQKCCTNRAYKEEQKLVYSCSMNCGVLGTGNVALETLGPATNSSIRYTCRSVYKNCTYPWIEPSEQTLCYVGQSYYNGSQIAGKPKPSLTICSTSQKCCTNRAYQAEGEQKLVYSCSMNCGILGDEDVTSEFLGPSTNSSIRFTCRGTNNWCIYPWQ